MKLLIVVISIIIFSLILNEYYFQIVLRNTQEHKILRGLKGKYDCVAFGSTYGLYGISFPEESNGFNFCLGGQFFYYTDKMLREYAPRCLKPGGTIYLVIADLVFAEVGKGLYHSERYPLILSRQSLGEEYSYVNYLRMRFPLFFNPRSLIKIARSLIKGNKNSSVSLAQNKLTYEQTLCLAKKRCVSWCHQFGLKNTMSNEISPKLEEKFAESRKVLTSMIKFCLDNGYKPILVVTPVSKAMNECISDIFIQKVLYDNINMANEQNVLFLNYLKDDEFQEISLYENNADCLNVRGRKLFTEILIKDSKKVVA